MDFKENKEAIIWTLLFVIATVAKFVYKYVKDLKQRTVDRIRKREVKRQKRAAQRKAEADASRKNRVGNTINPSDPWSGLRD